MDPSDGNECSSSTAAVREGLGRTMARRPALESSQTSRAVRERRVERLLWCIVGRKRKSIGEEQSVCLVGHSDQRAECCTVLLGKYLWKVAFLERVTRCFSDGVLVNSNSGGSEVQRSPRPYPSEITKLVWAEHSVFPF
jgi:hypothetical protein